MYASWLYLCYKVSFVVNVACKIINVSHQPAFHWYSKCEEGFVEGEISLLSLYYILVLMKADKSYALCSVTVW